MRTLKASAALALAAAAALVVAPSPAQDAAGTAASLQEAVLSFMRQNGIPGGELSVAWRNKIIFEGAYGTADLATGRPVKAGDLLRINSISKPVTATAVMTLVQSRRLSLDEAAFGRLSLAPFLTPGFQPDPRLGRISIRNLLQHTSGWQNQPVDPMAITADIGKQMGLTAPTRPEDVVRYMMGKPLQADPGTQWSYSNFGYCTLGRIIEKASGQTYGEYCQKSVLAPLGITGMRLGRSALAEAAPNEVRYYDGANRQVVGSVQMEVMDSHGGWLSSASDLVRLATGLAYPKGAPLISRQLLLGTMLSPQPAASGGPAYCGWYVTPSRSGRSLSFGHPGALLGSDSILNFRGDSEITYAVLFNKQRTATPYYNMELEPILQGIADTGAPAPPSPSR